MGHWRDYNLFRHCESYSPGSMLVAKVLSICSWVISAVVSVYYSTIQVSRSDGNQTWNAWEQNYTHPSSFTLNSTLGYIFWASLLNWQVLYLTQLFSHDASRVHNATAVSGHFIANNVLHSIFVALFVHSYFRWAEGILLLNFINLSVLQFMHKALPIQIHLPVASFPRSWTFVALYWNGFMMVANQSLVAAQVVGSVFVWAVLGYGLFSLFAFEDFHLCFCLSFLSFTIGVGQLERLASTPELISPFIIGSLLFCATVIQLKYNWRGYKSSKLDSPTDEKESTHLII